MVRNIWGDQYEGTLDNNEHIMSTYTVLCLLLLYKLRRRNQITKILSQRRIPCLFLHEIS